MPKQRARLEHRVVRRDRLGSLLRESWARADGPSVLVALAFVSAASHRTMIKLCHSGAVHNTSNQMKSGHDRI